jgi:hypothetical protein
MTSRIRTRPILILAVAGVVVHTAVSHAGDTIRIAPGRVQFTMKANGEWTGFGVRGERPLLESGGVVILSGRSGSAVLDERVSALHGGMRGLRAANEPMFEGMRGGGRYPSLQPDDDNDGRIDEDPWDGVDNDNDGHVDEDFAAIGDEMAVAVYGVRGDAALTVRQECYAWSLPNIDAMAASALTVTNASTRAIPHLRAGIDFEAAPGLEPGDAPVIEGSRSPLDAAFLERQIMFTDHNRALAVLLLVPRAQVASASAWELRTSHSRVTAISPDLGDLAPGAGITVYMALVALPSDDLKAAHAIRNAHRTMIGDGNARFIPPPISLMARGIERTSPGSSAVLPREAGGHDPFWTTAGKLQETLLVGSPNPFHDTVSIDYEIPHRVMDEDGVEHVLEGSAQPTSVKIYNVAGRLVATLLDEPRSPGKYRVDWTARGEDGASLASGVYYVKLQIGKRSVTMRMVQLK